MANVYLAALEGRANFSKLVVLKVMRASLAREPELVSLFMEEARLAARPRKRLSARGPREQSESSSGAARASGGGAPRAGDK